jgi:2-succinyl-5-enolpyruvyl-6-hydroxy-3-cyclohexene-1-carboxylate synthase
MAQENRNYVIAGAFVEALFRTGLRHVCICPGSRSTPLTISFDRVPGIRKWVHLDERSAGFFALGVAKYLGEPVALVCSSGTAAANFLPAVVEAHFSRTPLIVLTADRPPELVDWGSLQTIDQTRLYGSHVKWSVTMPSPEATPNLVAHARATAARAFATAAAAPAGPVHLNFPFREPLEPRVVPEDLPAGGTGLLQDAPPVRVFESQSTPPEAELGRLAEELRDIERGLIVCGPGPGSPPAEGVTALAGKLGYPVLADCLSGVRCGPHDRSLVIDCYDAFVGTAPKGAGLDPEVVLRFGAVPVSKPLVGFLERCRDARHIHVDGDAGWRDPGYLAGEMWRTEATGFCAGLAASFETGRRRGAWVNGWLTAADQARRAVRKELDGFEYLFEGRVFSEISRLLPDGGLLFAGNSMPVRDLDTFFPSSDRAITFFANRGASGIDGVTSSALGVAAAAKRRVTLVLGDISFYHDTNGLLAARSFGLDATIIVLNNDGGGIFSFLPQAAYEDVFEPYFGTPHGLTFKAAADLYRLDYVLADNWTSFTAAVKESQSKFGTTIIEVPGDRKRNAARHRQVRDAVVKALSGGRP